MIGVGAGDGYRETIEYHALADAGARSLCISGTNRTQECRFARERSGHRRQPGHGRGDHRFLQRRQRLSRTYGWIAAPALLTASNTTTPITQEVVGDQTWFRIDIPDGASSDITVHDERDTDGEFSVGWTVGLRQTSSDAESSKTQPT